MCIRSVGFGLLAGLWLFAVGGCQKSSPSEGSATPETKQASAPKAAAPETIAKLHWLGKKRLEGETNAAFFMSIWDLPESAKLEAQTLDKLAVAIARSLSNTTNAVDITNSAAAASVRPLLEDLLNEESYLELRGGSNDLAELGLAIRLNEDRADAWRTNLPKVFEGVVSSAPTGSPIDNHGWRLDLENPKSKTTNHLALARVGTWTVVSLCPATFMGGVPPAGGLLADFSARIQGNQAPFAAPATNFWLETEFDLGRIADAFGCNWSFPAGLPKVSLTMIGDGLNVRTRGELAFPQPLGLEFEPWNIPTNLVHNPLMSFTAINGIGPWIGSLPFWQNLKVESAPNQFYLWGLGGAAIQTYFAAPLKGSSNTVFALSGSLLDSCNRWLTTNKIGEFGRAADLNGLTWKGIPFIDPFLKEVKLQRCGFVYGGLGPESSLTNPAPEALILEITAHTNLFCYNWEITGPRIQACIYNSQAVRLIARKAQLPNGTSMGWLKALSLKLGNCGTELTASDPTHISFVRKSSFGLTAAELLFLVDWLESPSFPRGVHTFVAPPPPPPPTGVGH